MKEELPRNARTRLFLPTRTRSVTILATPYGGAAPRRELVAACSLTHHRIENLYSIQFLLPEAPETPGAPARLLCYYGGHEVGS